MGENTSTVSMAPAPPIWKTIQIGGKTKAELIAELEGMGMVLGHIVEREMMLKPAFETKAGVEEIDLIKTTVGELGFSPKATFKEIMARGKELGLGLCPAEVGPHLCLGSTYGDQPDHESLSIMMEQIVDSHAIPRVFVIKRFGKQWLDEAPARQNDELWEKKPIVFCRPRTS